MLGRGFEAQDAHHCADAEAHLPRCKPHDVFVSAVPPHTFFFVFTFLPAPPFAPSLSSIDCSSLQDIKEFKERMTLVPLRFVGEEELVGLARDSEAVFVLSADVRGVRSPFFLESVSFHPIPSQPIASHPTLSPTLASRRIAFVQCALLVSVVLVISICTASSLHVPFHMYSTCPEECGVRRVGGLAAGVVFDFPDGRAVCE